MFKLGRECLPPQFQQASKLSPSQGGPNFLSLPRYPTVNPPYGVIQAIFSHTMPYMLTIRDRSYRDFAFLAFSADHLSIH
jgi:hypothetical protein